MKSDSEHKLVLTRQTENFAEWECPVCNRNVRLGFRGGMQVIHPGDAKVNHGAAATDPLFTLSSGEVQSYKLH